MALIGDRVKPPTGPGGSVPTTDHSGVIFSSTGGFAEDKKRRRSGRLRTVTRKGEILTLDIRSESPWAYSMRADVIVEHVFNALLVHHQQHIIAGTKADGSGPQPPLEVSTLYSNVKTVFEKGKQAGNLKTDQRNRRSLHRGYKSGFFADTIRRSRLTGSTATAKTRMVSHPRRSVFLAMEAQRGYEYFFVDGAANGVIERAVAQIFDLSLEGRVRLKPEREGGVAASQL